MRPASLVTGLILLFIGGSIFAQGSSYYNQGRSFGGQVYQAFGGTNYTSEGTVLMVLGGIVALVGLVLIGKGFGSPKPASTPASPYATQTTAASSNPTVIGDIKFCPNCGTRMAKSSVFCPSCGSAQPQS